MLFPSGPRSAIDADRLVIQIQPAEGIQIHFQTKVPDSGMQLRQTDLSFNFRREFPGRLPDAYERLLVDVMQGDASLFARADEVELAWRIIDPILAAWEKHDQPPLMLYEPGLWGPAQCTQWLQDQGRQWFDVCPVLG
jgi:glucose-6-phosphate 1-dehydrogenase